MRALAVLTLCGLVAGAAGVFPAIDGMYLFKGIYGSNVLIGVDGLILTHYGGDTIPSRVKCVWQFAAPWDWYTVYTMEGVIGPRSDDPMSPNYVLTAGPENGANFNLSSNRFNNTWWIVGPASQLPGTDFYVNIWVYIFYEWGAYYSIDKTLYWEAIPWASKGFMDWAGNATIMGRTDTLSTFTTPPTTTTTLATTTTTTTLATTTSTTTAATTATTTAASTASTAVSAAASAVSTVSTVSPSTVSTASTVTTTAAAATTPAGALSTTSIQIIAGVSAAVILLIIIMVAVIVKRLKSAPPAYKALPTDDPAGQTKHKHHAKANK